MPVSVPGGISTAKFVAATIQAPSVFDGTALVSHKPMRDSTNYTKRRDETLG